MTETASPRRTTSLSRRLRAALVLLTLIPLALAGAVALVLGGNTLSQSLAGVSGEVARLSEVAARLSGYVQSREVALQGLAELSPLPTLPSEERRLLLERVRAGTDGIPLMGFYPPGREPAATMVGEGLRLRDDTSALARENHRIVEEALQGHRTRSRVLQPDPGKSLMILGQPLVRNGRVAGALVAWVDLEPALDLLRSESPRGRISVWLVEGRQILASAGQPEYLPRFDEQSGMRLEQSAQGPVLEGSVAVAPLGWHLLWAYPLPEVSEALRSLAVQVGITILAASLLAFLLGGVMARRIAAPVEALSDSALAIARGDYGAPTPDPGPYRELEVLTESFETMRSNLVRTLQENERLFLYTEELLRARVEELQVLYNLSEASTGRGDVTSLAGLLLEHIRRLLPNSIVALWLRDGTGAFALHALLGASELPSPPPVERLPGGIPLLVEQTMIHPPAEEARLHPLVADRFPGRVVSAYCLVALSVRGHLLGVLEVVPPEGARLEQGSVELLRALGREVGLALENARLYARSMAEKRFNEAVLEEMGDGVLTLDPFGRVATFNRAAERITGWDRRDVVGRSVDEVFRLAEAEHPLKVLVRPGSEAAPFEAEVPLLQGSRKVLLFNPTIPPLVEGADEAPAVIVVFRDISRIRELEDLRRDFTATISHELRTPLTSIKGYLATLMHPRAKFDPETVNGYLGIINNQVDHLNRLIADLLEAARLRNAALEVHPRRVELTELLKARMAFAPPGPTLRLEGEPPIWAWCDPDHLGYVVDHLLSNAVKYSLPRGEVVVRAVREPGRIRLSVQDFGIGIPPDQQERIFELYHRVESGSTRVHYGAGVGLFIARRIVEAHGGTLGVQSQPGSGSTFTVTMPAADEREATLGR